MDEFESDILLSLINELKGVFKFDIFLFNLISFFAVVAIEVQFDSFFLLFLLLELLVVSCVFEFVFELEAL